ncbi:MAG: TrmB family transcriptional regulator [Thermoplasmatales archaeon]
MDDSKIFQDLSRFGLSPYEVKVLSTLLLKGPLTSMDVVRASGVPQPRIYDIFESLIRKGFVEVSPGRRRIYRAIPLSISLERQLDELRDIADSVSSYVQEHQGKKTNETPLVWLIEGREHVISRIRNMINESKSEIILSITYDTFRAIRKYMEKAVSRGVTVAVVLFPDTPIQRIQALEGIVAKRRESVASEVIIVDRDQALLNVNNYNSDQNYALYFEENELIHVLNYYYFHTIWEPSSYVNTFSSSKSLKFTTSWLACEAIDQISKSGRPIKGELRCLIGDQEHTIIGTITGTKRIPGLQHAFFIEADGRTYSVGGRTARLEDAKLIEIKIN